MVLKLDMMTLWCDGCNDTLSLRSCSTTPRQGLPRRRPKGPTSPRPRPPRQVLVRAVRCGRAKPGTKPCASSRGGSRVTETTRDCHRARYDVITAPSRASLLAKLRIILCFADLQNHAFFGFKCLDPGSGRTIPAIWHDAGAYPRNLALKTG